MSKVDAQSIRFKADNIMRVPLEMRGSMAKALRPQVAELAAQLDRQYEWLGANTNHARHAEFEDQWIRDLRHYEAAVDVLDGIPEQKGLVA
jgi:hypothetical protein